MEVLSHVFSLLRRSSAVKYKNFIPREEAEDSDEYSSSEENKSPVQHLNLPAENLESKEETCFECMTPQQQEWYVVKRIARAIPLVATDERDEFKSFCGAQMTTVPIETYVARLVRFCNKTPLLSRTNKDGEEGDVGANSVGINCALIALELLDGIQVTERSQHRLFMIAFLLAIKTHALDGARAFDNASYVNAAGCALHEVNWMERLFLTQVKQWRGLHVSQERFEARRCKVFL